MFGKKQSRIIAGIIAGVLILALVLGLGFGVAKWGQGPRTTTNTGATPTATATGTKPALQLDKTALTVADCIQDTTTAGTLDCSDNLTATNGSIPWTVTAKSGKATFTPASGTATSTATQISIVIPQSDTNDTFTFQSTKQGVKAITVSWTSGPVTTGNLNVSPATIDLNSDTNHCTRGAGVTRICQVNVSNNTAQVMSSINVTSSDSTNAVVKLTDTTLKLGKNSYTGYVFTGDFSGCSTNSTPTSVNVTFDDGSGGDTAVLTVTCTKAPGDLTAVPATLSNSDQTNCPINPNGWTCNITLQTSKNGVESWQVQTDPADITASPTQGVISYSTNRGMGITLQIRVPQTDCTTKTNSGTISILSGNQGQSILTIPWTCSQPNCISPTQMALLLSTNATTVNANQLTPGDNGCSFQLVIQKDGYQALMCPMIKGDAVIAVFTDDSLSSTQEGVLVCGGQTLSHVDTLTLYQASGFLSDVSQPWAHTDNVCALGKGVEKTTTNDIVVYTSDVTINCNDQRITLARWN